MITDEMKPGRVTDTFEEAMAHMMERDPSLWHILNHMWRAIVNTKYYFLILIALGISNNKWVDKALELFSGVPAAAAVLFHHT